MVEKRNIIWVSMLAIVLLSVPYLIAFFGGNEQWEFGGFLLNPVDGHSYLAKMQQGYQGEWKFVLPYTSEPGNGAFLFIFYIGLGHLARILSFPLIWIFHAFRLIGAIFLISMLWKLSGELITEEKERLLLFCLTVFGSGLGWIGVLGGLFTSDFWVAEAYPFLSMYANPHFPLGLGLMVWVILPGKHGLIRYIIGGLAIAVIQPFAVVIVIVITLFLFIFDLFKMGNINIEKLLGSDSFIRMIGIGVGGGSILLYQYLSILKDPVLAVWNQQNLTPPPTLVDFIFSFSPVLLLAGFGIKNAINTDIGKKMLIWAVASITLIMIPWNLQRRFLTGLYVPLAGLAVLGLKELASRFMFNSIKAIIIVVILAVPTNLIILISGIQASLVQDKNIYYSVELVKAFDWINEYTDHNDLILADKTKGLLIPSLTGRRVIYGHPFETINVEAELEFINGFFEGRMDEKTLTEYLKDRHIAYILIDKTRRFMNEIPIKTNGFNIVFENSEIVIYQSN